MTFDLCEKFVGPMPVNVFLKEFVPEAPAARPHDNFTFCEDSVSQNEDEFVCIPILIDVQTFKS
jgi:hypothetical protein